MSDNPASPEGGEGAATPPPAPVFTKGELCSCCHGCGRLGTGICPQCLGCGQEPGAPNGSINP